MTAYNRRNKATKLRVELDTSFILRRVYCCKVLFYCAPIKAKFRGYFSL